MPRLRIPITKKQHAIFVETYRQINALNASVMTAAQAIVAGTETDVQQASVAGVDDTDGVFQLLLDTPEPPPASPPAQPLTS